MSDGRIRHSVGHPLHSGGAEVKFIPHRITTTAYYAWGTQGRLRSWFAQHNASLVVMRPDRFVAATAIPQTLGNTLNKSGVGDDADPP